MDRFRSIVEETWRGTIVQGKASYIVTCKLKALKTVIKQWTKNEQEKEREELTCLFTDLGELDSKDEASGLDEEEKKRRNGLKLKVANLMYKDEVSRKHKSR